MGTAKKRPGLSAYGQRTREGNRPTLSGGKLHARPSAVLLTGHVEEMAAGRVFFCPNDYALEQRVKPILLDLVESQRGVNRHE